MIGNLISLLMGLAVGAAYGLVQIRSPAPPIIALVGLFGMVAGQHVVDVARQHLSPPVHISVQHTPGNSQPNIQPPS